MAFFYIIFPITFTPAKFCCDLMTKAIPYCFIFEIFAILMGLMDIFICMHWSITGQMAKTDCAQVMCCVQVKGF